MKIQAPKRILTNDFSEDNKEIAGKIGGLLNTYNEELYQALSSNLTISDNLDQDIKVITLTVNASGIPTTTISFQNSLKNKLQGMNVIRAIGNNYPTAHPFISYSEANKIVTIDHISGLVGDTQYQLVIHLIGQ